jgi:methylglutaconyl-CoA hydratase
MSPQTSSGERPAQRVRFRADGGVARVTLANPGKRNALSPETIRQLKAALSAAGRDHTVRVILLSAEGPDFCAGADLAALADLADASPDVHRADAAAFADLLLAIRKFPRPVVVAVHGRALAGGAGLATACDVVLASDSASFGYPEVKIGFVAAVVMALLRESVGEKPAFDLVITGRAITAAEAQRIGLVSRVLPASELEESALALAQEIAALPEASVAATKRLFHELRADELATALARGVAANVAARSTADFREGLSRFLTRQDRRRE